MSKSIVVEILGDASNFAKELDKATGTTKRFGAAAKVAAAAVGGALVVGLTKSVQAAIDAQDSHRRLDQAFKNVGLSADKYAGQVDAAEASSRKLGFTGNDVRDSLGSLLTATGNVGASIKDLGIAQDLARFKGVDLETATRTLTAAMTGSQRAIKSLGIAITPVTTNVDELKTKYAELGLEIPKAELAQAKLQDKMATGQAVIKATSELVKGQGQAYAETAAGGMARFHAEIDNIEVIIGTKLIPTLTFLITKGSELAAFLSANLGPTVRNLSALFLKYQSEIKAVANALSTVLKAALTATRVVLEAWIVMIRADIAVLGALLNATRAVASFLAGAFNAAVNGARTVIRALDTALDGVKAAFNAVRSAASAVAAFLRGGLSSALNAFRSVAGAVRSVINAIASALNAAASAARALAGALASIHVPHISLPHIGLPHVPGFASGVRNFTGGAAIVGESGPELVRLPRGSDVIPDVSFAGAGGGEFHIHLHGNYVDNKQALIRDVRDGIVQAGRRNGGGMLGGQG